MFSILALSVRLPCRSLKRTTEFYTKLLGFSVQTAWPEENPEYAGLRFGDVLVAFYEVSDLPAIRASFVLETDDAMEIYRRVQNEATVLWGPEVYFYGCREFCFEDPDGHQIIISEITNDPVTCEG